MRLEDLIHPLRRRPHEQAVLAGVLENARRRVGMQQLHDGAQDLELKRGRRSRHCDRHQLPDQHGVELFSSGAGREMAVHCQRSLFGCFL